MMRLNAEKRDMNVKAEKSYGERDMSREACAEEIWRNLYH